MKSSTVAAFLAMAGISTTTLAAAPHMSDAQYIAAARCEGLMTSSALGQVDAAGIHRLLDDQARGRQGAVLDRADEARETALQSARHGGVYGKAALIAERDGACHALTGLPTYAGVAQPAGAARTN